MDGAESQTPAAPKKRMALLKKNTGSVAEGIYTFLVKIPFCF